ncbi:MAG: hypothetical protein WKF37_10805 [Bryobacteraceae bacterium]
MPTGSLRLKVTDLLDEPIIGRIGINLAPTRESPGGSTMQVDLVNQFATELLIKGVECRGGPGTLYSFRIETDNFRPYTFFQLIREGRVNTASDGQVRLVVNPKRVKDIKAPAFSSMSSLKRMFLKEPAFYDSLDPLQKACVLNVLKKAESLSLLRSLQSLLELRQDRCFCTVDSNLPESLRKSDRFKSASNVLHEPLKSFALEDSFKSRDVHANIQFTFMRHTVTGALAADVDIDEMSGIEHGFEVIRNEITGTQTNPYLIRELMLLSEPVEGVLDPGYRFIFK